MQPKIDSEDCELLADLAKYKNINSLAKMRRRDTSVISRKLQQLANKAPVLEKRTGRWHITPLGTSLIHLANDFSLSQKKILQQPIKLRIATNREFAARVLAPALGRLKNSLGNEYYFEIYSYETGAENQLLNGEIDFAIDCGHPHSPDIQFKLLAKENFSLVASPKFLQKNPIRKLEDLRLLPHIEFSRMRAIKYLKFQEQLRNRFAKFNDISACRAAAVAGLGWALLPKYTIAEELLGNKLVSLELLQIEQDSYGLWWLRERTTLQPILKKMDEWLRTIEL